MDTNLHAIRNALRVAAKGIVTTRPGLKLIRDEATRDTSGAPNIVSKIVEKIEQADIFAADITTITPRRARLALPNANVVFELRLAVAELGWDRVILLFNTEHGNFPRDLPFDFVQNRASPYAMRVHDKDSSARLSSLLEMAIGAVIKKNPKRPAELKGLSREKLRHQHDVENMNWLMSTMHLPTLDEHIESLPHIIIDRGIWFFENSNAVFVNSLFRVYDENLSPSLERFFSAWNMTLSHDEHYRQNPAGNLHLFGDPGDAPFTDQQRQAWDEINTARSEMRRSLDDILARLRESYIEVNLHKTSANAWSEYSRMHAEVRRRLR